MTKDKSSILKVCVDDPSVKLPSFVNAVPLIYIPKDKRVIVDDAVEMWIGTNFGSGNTTQSNNQLESKNNVTSFKTSNSPSNDYYTGGFSFSTQFSAIDGSEDINGLDGGCGFADLSSPQESIVTPKDDGNKLDTNAMFEQYQQMRNKEFSGKSRN